MKTKRSWFENDAFWKATRPILFHRERIESAGREVEQVISLLGLKSGARVLDLCCGVGRHSLELARRGFKVTGVDRNAEYMKEAKQRAREAGLTVELVRRDMRDFCRPETFDAAINMFTSFGYFKDHRDDQRVARAMVRSLKPGGRLLIETMGKEVMARIFRPRDWYEQSGYLVLEERRVTPDWSRIESQWVLIKGTMRREFAISLRLYSACELWDLLRRVGFKKGEFFGSLAGTPYDHQASRLVAVAKKG